MGSFIAMDAEQKRDADGKFGSGGGSGHKIDVKDGRYHVMHKTTGEHLGTFNTKDAAESRATNIANDDNPFQPDPTASMQGEAGRQARKQARDCMSGRYRP